MAARVERFTLACKQVRGQGRPRFSRFGNHHAYKSDEDRAWERSILDAYSDAGYYDPLYDGPVELYVQVERALPAGRPKRVVEEADVFKPDASNILKSVEDALNGKAWKDDSQVTMAAVCKKNRTRRDGDLLTVEISKEAR